MILSRDDETIIAQCTPIGSGALALIRLSGINAIAITTAISKLPGAKTIDSALSHTIHFGWVIDDNNVHIDQVLFLVMHEPKTFTGQNTVEITCHNNQFIIESIISQAIKHGARLAQAGEFTKRAYLNKKIDLTQAEAINELIHAHTQEALKKSLSQLEGSFSHWLGIIQEKLLHALTLCEASFEFLEDETINFDHEIRTIIQHILKDIEESQTHYNQQQHLKEGIRIALIGAVNVGKSSLFNKLIKSDRAIVTEIAGTTRDVIESSVYRNNVYITFVDTAGIRQTKDRIETEGIKRSFQEADKADIIVLVIDNNSQLTSQEQEIYQQLINRYRDKIIPIAAKSDLPACHQALLPLNFLPISSKTGTNIDHLEQIISQKIQTFLQQCTMPFLINMRQHKILQALYHDLEAIDNMTNTIIEHELVAIHLKDALEKLTELTGKSISELGLNEIFKNFCVGK